MLFTEAEHLHNIAAAIGWTPIVWPKISISRAIIKPSDEHVWRWITDKIRNWNYQDSKTPFPNPINKDPRFWEKVRQLYFAFKNHDISRIEKFYGSYGPLGPGSAGHSWEVYAALVWDMGNSLGEEFSKYLSLIDRSFTFESWDWCEENLDWFRMLTVLTEHIKQGRTSALWEIINKASSDMVFDGAVSIQVAPNISVWRNPHLPETDEQSLVPFVWFAILESVKKQLRQIHLDFDARPPNAKGLPFCWSFRPKGAIEAAFLQWCFQELAPMATDIKECARSDCNNLVFGSRKKYCSERCYRTQKKRRYRQRKREEGRAQK
ncbi:MAG TPA: hypothetical protein GX529_06430 [Firmicutes bacterium]|nr:hypothetical protein [Candidatus Fermentithermobacillaceae bacterium]